MAARPEVPDGWTVLRTGSYRRSQERHRVAQMRLALAEQRTARMEAWGREAHRETARLIHRLTYVYGVAVAHGATHEDLQGPVAGAVDALAELVRLHDDSVIDGDLEMFEQLEVEVWANAGRIVRNAEAFAMPTVHPGRGT